MNVVLVGYGRMGREVEAVLDRRGHRIAGCIDPSPQLDLNCPYPVFRPGDPLPDETHGIIEFALKPGIEERVAAYGALGIPAVIGTTGLDARVPELKKTFSDAAARAGKSQTAAIVRGNNFSVGAHLFFRLTAAAAKLMNRTEEYDVSLIEYHHNKKADHPSGTAITAAEGILDRLDRKTHILSSLPDGPVPPEALHVSAVRVGAVPGIHEMHMDSTADYLTIRHEARSRGGFALGSVQALEWLQGRSGWFEADDFIDHLLTGERS